MKTFVTDDYQITLEDDGGITLRRYYMGYHMVITYRPDEGDYCWAKIEGVGDEALTKLSRSISGLGLLKPGLVELHKALELVGKQDLMDKEIVFVENEKVSG